MHYYHTQRKIRANDGDGCVILLQTIHDSENTYYLPRVKEYRYRRHLVKIRLFQVERIDWTKSEKYSVRSRQHRDEGLEM